MFIVIVILLSLVFFKQNCILVFCELLLLYFEFCESFYFGGAKIGFESEARRIFIFSDFRLRKLLRSSYRSSFYHVCCVYEDVNFNPVVPRCYFDATFDEFL